MATAGSARVRANKSATREDYMVVGLQTLADQGHLGLKLAEVCSRLMVTSGSFYHFFGSWAQYRTQVIEYWKNEATLTQLRLLRGELDPYRRIERLVEVALSLDHTAEGAIRAWSRVDPDVHAVQAEVDELRRQVVFDSALQIANDEPRANRFADAALYLLIGYEQAALAPDLDGLEAIFRDLLSVLEGQPQ
ncbi:TetR/AcrR family transcriptional regulator [Mycobacteriaceae bacterium Msp059]|nr:TetR/AcrR family transcriptional regulator [Mycobacteriaceae bacterium Msp059]